MQIAALGAVIGLEFDASVPDDAAEALKALWASAATAAPAGVSLSVGLGSPNEMAFKDVSSSDLDSLAAMLSTRVTLAAIENRKSTLIMLHACGVALDDGSVIAFVGPSGRGKTTLARSLGQQFGYVTDETVGIGPDGRVYPYRKPLSVITDARATWLKSQIPPELLGLRPLTESTLRIAAIVLLDRDPSHEGAPSVEDVNVREAILALVPELSYLPELPDPLVRLSTLIDEVGGVKRLRYSEAASVPALIPDLVEGPKSHDWRRITGRTSLQEAAAGQFIRAAVLDQVDVENEYLILHGRHVHVLNGIGPAIWDVLEEPRDLAEIVDRVVARHGTPADAAPEDLVRSAIASLIDSGLIHAKVES